MIDSFFESYIRPFLLLSGSLKSSRVVSDYFFMYVSL
jgi:hypothetical protein